MVTTSLLMLCWQIIALFFQLGNILSRPSDVRRKRFIYLTIIFLLFNLSWYLLCLYTQESDGMFRQVIVGIVAIAIGAFCYRMVLSELMISSSKVPLRKILRLGLIISALIILVTTTLYVSFTFPVFVTSVVFFSVFLSSFITWQVLFSFTQDSGRSRKSQFGLFFIGNYSGLLLIILVMPALAVYGFSTTGLILANLSYLSLFIAYLTIIIRQSSKGGSIFDHESFQQIGEPALDYFFSKELKSLTETERTIAIHILEGYQHKEIAVMLYVTTNTITSHASNIYKKTGCMNRKEFRQKFQHLVSAK